MRFDTVIIGGGLAGLVAGISLQQAGRSTAIVSTGQNALHFFSGSFESMLEAPERLTALFAGAGIRVHYNPGFRLTPLGTFREAALSLEDISLFPEMKFADKALIACVPGYLDYFSAFLAEGLERQGIQCRLCSLDLPEELQDGSVERRSVQLARLVDRDWKKIVQQIRLLIKDEDAVILPQLCGLQDASVPEHLRQEIPARVVFAGTMPPSIPGIRTQRLLKRRFEVLGGTYLSGDEALGAEVKGNKILRVRTRNLDVHALEATNFILATGSFFSKGLRSNPFRVWEPVFGLDVDYDHDRNAWYNPEFAADQPYMQYGVKTDATLHALVDGTPRENLYVIGSVLGGTRPELGSGAGLAIRSAFAAVDQILGSL
jgi:glycerol-3-phosphate dehydrogenase subunit B